MSFKYAAYTIPALGTLCVAGAVAVVISARAPVASEIFAGDGESYDQRVPENFEPSSDIPTMEQVVEKHLFVKERKATGQNTFPDLLVKGVYVGEESSAVFSLKYRPQANVRVWKGDVDSVIKNITNERDPRKPIVDFLGEWDIKEITFRGVTVEHIITGEVETYLVDYIPAKHVTDNAEAGYGQGMLAVTQQAGTKTTKTSTKQTTSGASQTQQQRAQAFSQLRTMVEQMSPEQRARLAERIKGGDQSQSSSRNSSGSSSSRNETSSGGSSSRGGGGTRGGGGSR